ncbi:MAG: hypothetical protein AAF501_20215, partial [Pseudomonadota bacterium]
QLLNSERPHTAECALFWSSARSSGLLRVRRECRIAGAVVRSARWRVFGGGFGGGAGSGAGGKRFP